MFNEIHSSQWLWYYYNFTEDMKESFETERDLVEYNASFVEPEAVRKIREAREKAIIIPEEQFMSGIEKMFGRPLNIKEKPQEQKMQNADMSQILDKFNQKKDNNEQASSSYKDWLNVKLEK
jgi:hypothetical protein